MPLAAGNQLGPYEIIGPLGAGGMGEVYRARDSRLLRDVALKILPPEFAVNPDRRHRFAQEARAIAALNHPNIVAVYDVGENYFVSELVDGEPLRGAGLPLRKIIDMAAQIAEGLAAAHSAGITHRDLKPANILLTREGRVKILDFGLAKFESAHGEHDPTLTDLSTDIGVVMGTVGYMSPEQVRGQTTEYRSDIFSFGVILYELLAGRRAFQRQSAAETMSAIATEEPPELPDSVPPALRQIVMRCIEKNPAQRFQSSYDLAFALRTLSQPSTAIGPTPAVPVKPRRRRFAAAITALALLALGLLAGRTFWRAPSQPSWSGVMLGGPNFAKNPRVSPSGRMIAFHTMVDDQTQVAVMQPPSGNWMILTRDTQHGEIGDVTWSHDESRLYYSREFGGEMGIFSVPALGGEERPVLDNATSPQALPDGSLVVVRPNDKRQNQLFRFWPDSGRLQALPAQVPAFRRYYVRVSFDGREVFFVGWLISDPGPDSGTKPGLHALDLASGSIRLLAAGLPFIDSPGIPLAVSRDGQTLFCLLQYGNLYRIVSLPVRGAATPQTVLTLTLRPWSLDTAPDGSLYLDQVESHIEVLRFSPTGGAPDRINVPPVPVPNTAAVPLPDGRLIVASRAGRERLVVLLPGGATATLAETTEETAPPVTLLNSREVAFLLGSEGSRTIAIASIAGGRILRRLKSPPGLVSDFNGNLAASPDGQTLYCAASGMIWALPSGGGEPRKMASGYAVAVDPRGRELFIKRAEKDTIRLVRVPLSGGPEIDVPVRGNLRLTEEGFGPNAVGPNGKILLHMSRNNSWYWQAALLNPDTGETKAIPLNYHGDVFLPTWSPDGRITAMAVESIATLWRFWPEAGSK